MSDLLLTAEEIAKLHSRYRLDPLLLAEKVADAATAKVLKHKGKEGVTTILCPCAKGEPCPIHNKHRSRPELRDKMLEILRECYGFVPTTVDYEHALDQLLLLYPDEEEIKERLLVIIEDYKLDRVSVRDDVLERQADGWAVLKQALKGK